MNLEFESPSSPLLLNRFEVGRLFQYEIRIGLAETDVTGRLRFDALARIAQDIAGADLEDSGIGDEGVWILRRSGLRINHDVIYGSRLMVSTFCSGIGRSWASRRTVISRGDAAVAEVASLWIQTDPGTRAPKSLSENFMEIYGQSSMGRRVSTRLATNAIDEAKANVVPWTFRFCDFDLIGHVNNVSYIFPLEDALSNSFGKNINEARVDLDVLIEYRDGVNLGSTYEVRVDREDPLNLDFYSEGDLAATVRVTSRTLHSKR